MVLCVQGKHDFSNRETGILQQRLLELDGTVEELEHDRTRIKRAYTELMDQATKTIESMDSDIQVSQKNIEV